MADANMAKLSSMHFYAWKKGLKTGYYYLIISNFSMYYLRTRAASDAIKFTLDVEQLLKNVGDINARSVSQPIKADKEEEKADVNFKDYLQKKKVKVECTEDICTSCGS